MNTEKASVKLSFEKTASQSVSVKIRVTFKREQRRFAFPFKDPVLVSPADFDRILAVHQKTTKGRIAEEVKTLYDKLLPYLQRAELLADSLSPFTFARFKEAFYSSASIALDKTAVITLLDERAAKLNAADQIGNADNYTSSARSFERFIASLSDSDRRLLLGASPALLLSHITPDFLAKYESWMLQYGKAPRSPKGSPTPAGLTTISIYTRNLRAIFNEAIDAGLISAEAYPFSKKGYTIPASVNVKKSLSKQQVLDIIAYPTIDGTTEQRSKCFWVFSYLSNGMNLADIFRLRWKDVNLETSELTFIRQKTTRTSRAKQIKVVCKLFPQSLAILNEWGNKNRGPMDYLFPYITDEMDARRKKAVIKQLVKQTNKYMGRVAQALGIQEEVNTYAARHSFATILLRSEAPVAFISQSLGHASLKTTEDYLGSFEDEQTTKYLSNLL